MYWPTTLAAGNLDTLIGVTIAVVSFIGWIMNYAKAKPQPPNRAGGARPNRPRSERIQSEIEQFMRDQARKKEQGDQAAPRPQPQQQSPPRAIPPAAVKGQQRRTAKQQSARPDQQRPRQPEPEPAAQRPGEEFSHRKSVGTEGLGSGVRKHLQSAMAEHVQSDAQTYLRPSVSSEVAKHLGAFSGNTAPSAAAKSPLQTLVDDLRTPEGIRKAFVMQLILEPPPSRRPR